MLGAVSFHGADGAESCGFPDAGPRCALIVLPSPLAMDWLAESVVEQISEGV